MSRGNRDSNLAYVLLAVMVLKRAVWPEVDVDWELIGFVEFYAIMAWSAIVEVEGYDPYE